MPNFPGGQTIEYDIESEQCIVCGKQTTFCCSRCRRVFYCSQSCQRVDWRSHKLTCEEVCTPKEPTPAIAEWGDESTLPRNQYEAACEAFKAGLMARFGSIVSAYEWFDSESSGRVTFGEFSKTLPSFDKRQTRELFTALDKAGRGSISLSEFLTDAVKRLGPPSPVKQPPLEDNSPSPISKTVTDPSLLPSSRRALRAAAVLAYRNGRYEDAIVGGMQALGLTSLVGVEAKVPVHPDNLVELLLLGRATLALNKGFSSGTQLLNLITAIVPLDGGASLYADHVRLTLLCTVADLCAGFKKSDLAGQYYVSYLHEVESVFGADSLAFGDALTIVGSYFLKSPNNTQRAIDATELAKDIRKKHLPSTHVRVADAYVNLGIALKAGSEFAKAAEMFGKALEIRSKIFGHESLPVADVLFSLGACCLETDLEKAVDFFSRCKSIRTKLVGLRHAETLLAEEALNKAQIALNPRKDTVKVAPLDLYRTRVVEGVEKPETRKPPKILSVVTNNPRPPVVATTTKPAPTPRIRTPMVRLPRMAADPPVERVIAEVVSPKSDPGSPISISPSPPIQPARPDTGISSEKTESKQAVSEAHFEDTSEPVAEPGSEPDSGPMSGPESAPSEPSSEPAVCSPVSSPLSTQSFTLFEDFIAEHGQQACVTAVSQGDPRLFPFVDLDLKESLPASLPESFALGVELAYLRRAGQMEMKDDTDDKLIEDFFADLKFAHEDLRSVFSLLNTVNRSINGTELPLLNLSTFSEFIRSKTENVALLEYLAKGIGKLQPDLVQRMIANTALVDDVVQIDIKAFLLGLQAEFKSIDFVETQFKNRTTPPPDDSSPEANITREVVRVRQAAADIKLTLEERIKKIAEGISVLVELFQIPQVNIVNEIDDAVDALHEFRSGLVAHVEVDPEN